MLKSFRGDLGRWVVTDVPRFVDQSIGADQHGDQDVLINLTEVRSSDRTDQTNRAIPRASRLQLRLEPRPDDRTDRPQPVFLDQLDILRPTVELDLAWVVKKPKTYMHSYPADHSDSPASVLIFTPCIHLVRMNLDILTSLLHFPCLDQI